MPESILNATSALLQTPTYSEVRHRDTALYHANLLQQRKDVEAQILNATETLLELPASTTDPARPFHKEAATVVTSLQLFRPSDFDALIAERNINRQCGYVLCPHPNRKQQAQARYRIIHGRGKGADSPKIVEKDTLEKWCSDDCGRRALYIRLQLSDEPAWARNKVNMVQAISLLEDAENKTNAKRVDSAPENTACEEKGEIARSKILAIERGDRKDTNKVFGLAEIKEKFPIETQNQRKSLDCKYAHDSVEGFSFRPKAHGFRVNDVEDGERDVIDTI